MLFAIAFAAERLLFPDILPIVFANEAQPSRAALTALALRAIELTAAWIAIMSLSIMTGAWVKDRLRRSRRAPSGSSPASPAD
ncbi:hypothetical protein [Bradyrhizobium sp.]|uniref:hypothetical protein n=1 Tax=Bradyrhizobium sp. TaxID=376 RepID=UPI00260968AC|nr:hypothetical protein [Bradyrhizobium sp.]